MARDKYIVLELNELNSSLGEIPEGTLYSVPSGYFEELVTVVLRRIHAGEAKNAVAELSVLSPLLSGMTKAMPFTVPAGYFEKVVSGLPSLVRKNEPVLSAQEEIESLSPLLGGLKKKNPFEVPAGYFEKIGAAPERKAKVVSLVQRTWFRYAAVAVVSGLIALTGLLFFNNKGTGRVPLARFSRDVKKMDDQVKESLIDFIDAGMNGKETAKLNPDNKTKEIRDLLQDVPEQELKDFQEQTEDVQEVLMVN